MPDPNVPGAPITAFDRGQYEKLIKAIDSVDHSLSQQFLKPGVDIRLDGTLGSRMHVGDQAWSAVTDFINSAKEFGSSVDKVNRQYSNDWRGFIDALNKAKDVFEETNDLANFSADKFVNEYPDIAGSAGAGGYSSYGGGAGGGGSSTYGGGDTGAGGGGGGPAGA
ncbi:hypothetical protein [Saccharopolyspora phatthalungensis]|uniref:Putative membrane protein YgcG n=1 Tax=Saccharopolyspora phatthalungensis TaxID=664693 RepID=A0A840PZ38_9PSEU|nr:hypothetical protein [Saccharopolyspora phatthalungensis]MBB5152471.1 putative membrane protein YgcG [Saccharopolyspora phatthalungensis]